MIKINKYITVIMIGILGMTLSSCEDVVDVQPDSADTFIVIDAWLNNRTAPQTIRLTKSQPFFNNTFSPAITGATVHVLRNGVDLFDFADQGDGNYVLNLGDDNLGNVGDNFELQITIEGKEYNATSTMNRVPAVDSISQEILENDIQGPDGIYAEFFSRDLVGVGDAYWIKTFKNGNFLNKPEEINIAFDAGFDSGQDLDGLIFIPPVRSLVNPVPDSLSSEVPYWDPGDEIRVEIHSISVEAFNFMEMARNQMLNGNNGLFAMPIANSRGNIEVKGSDTEVLGMFCVSAISSLTKVFE